MDKNKIIAYALDFVAYLIEKVEGINQIILYGSTFRGDFIPESDIDLFIDISDKKIENKVKKCLESYHLTGKYKSWKLRGIEKEFSLIIGKLDSREWKDLRRAMINEGMILYGKYKAEIEKINHYTLIVFENIKPDKKRIKIYRKLFGFKIGKKRYPGLIEKTNSIKAGKGSILVPIEHVNTIKKYLQEKNVQMRLFDLWSDEKI